MLMLLRSMIQLIMMIGLFLQAFSNLHESITGEEVVDVASLVVLEKPSLSFNVEGYFFCIQLLLEFYEHYGFFFMWRAVVYVNDEFSMHLACYVDCRYLQSIRYIIFVLLFQCFLI